MNASSASGPASRAIQFCWKVVRAPIGMALLALEPIVGWICGLAMVLGLFAATMFEISAVGPRFPFLQVAGVSLGFGVVLILYYGLLSFFVAD